RSVMTAWIRSAGTGEDYSSRGPIAWPRSFSLDAFSNYLSMVDFPVALWNSVLISTVVAFGGVALSLLSAYQIGAGRIRGSGLIVLPILRPTLSVLVVFFFIWTWNEFYIPVVLLADQSSQTVPIALSTLRGQHSIDITVLNAGSLLSLLPTLVFFLIFQRTLNR